jgi:hypothetical protein
MIYTTTHVTSATTLPPYAIPVDPLQTTDTLIKTSNPPAQRLQPPTKPNPQQWYERAPQEWNHLVGTITLRQSEETIAQLIDGKTKFELASDGGHDPASGISTFGWVATINRTIIANGRGPAQAHPTMAESFRSEGYGIASAGLFIRNLVKRFNIKPTQHSWFLYVDNKSMIQRLQGYEEHDSISRWNLRSDEDIAKVAHTLLKTVPIRIKHIKSHQDANRKQNELSFEAELNILADKEATRQRTTMEKPASSVQNIGTAQLQIGNMAVTRDSQRWLMQTAGRIPIEQYYRERHNWSRATFDDIGWDTQLVVLRQYTQEDQTRVIKFVHGWLPTQHRKHKEGAATSPQCKLCKAQCENNIHLFLCNHQNMTKIQTAVSTHLLASTQDHGHSELNNIIDIGLTESTVRPSWTPDMKYISMDLNKSIAEQNRIGWQQVYYGRISKKLINFMDQHYQQLPVNHLKYTGERWARALIKKIWDTMLQLWKERNDQIHQVDKGKQVENQKQRLERRIARCYEYSNNLTATERLRWFSDTRTEIMLQDTRYLEAWVRTVERIISITKRERKKRPPESLMMERFLKTPSTTSAQKAHTSTSTDKPRRFTHELNPD